ncbi:glycosyltransferase family 1 protein [Pseudoalteromonas sp. BZB3]|uniref:glycosyltransferase family 4 protein n=1 Tax=Pseudoalteromonas sp. BZB3 TaxID=3136670 RepID=UPI0032C4778B
MKVGIDARWMVGKYRGMGKFAWQLINPVKDSSIAYVTRKQQSSKLTTVKSGHSFFPYWEQLVLPWLAKRHSLSHLVCPYNTAPIFLNKNTKLVVVVHDLIFMRSFKELPLSQSIYQSLGRLYRMFVVPLIINKADTIITVSEYTAEEIRRDYGDNLKVFVIPNSIPSKWLDSQVLDLKERSNYILTVAGDSPSKNLDKVITAFSQSDTAEKMNTKLLVVGIRADGHKKYEKLIESLGMSGRVEFIDFVDESELIKLYSYAKGFVFGSLFEGFGIPLLEAMSRGTPIACSNTTSMPEVVGNSAYLFDPKCTKSMSQNIDYILNCNNQSRVNLGLERVKQFTEENIQCQFEKLWSKLDDK